MSPGSHCLDYLLSWYPVMYSSLCNWFEDRGTRRFHLRVPRSSNQLQRLDFKISSNELQWLFIKIGDQDSCLSKGHKGDMLYFITTPFPFILPVVPLQAPPRPCLVALNRMPSSSDADVQQQRSLKVGVVLIHRPLHHSRQPSRPWPPSSYLSCLWNNMIQYIILWYVTRLYIYNHTIMTDNIPCNQSNINK